MKKLHRILLIAIMITVSSTLDIYSQPPPPPSGHSETGNAAPGSGGGAPIGGGTLVLIGLAAVYGGKKVFDIRKESLEE